MTFTQAFMCIYSAWLLYVEDFMVKDVKFIAFDATYNDLQSLILETKHRSYPLVDAKGILFFTSDNL